MERVDSLAELFNVLANAVWDELGDNFLQVALLDLLLHDLNHLLSDGPDLCALSVGSLLSGRLLTGSESNAEEAEEVSIGCLHIDVGLDQSLRENC